LLGGVALRCATNPIEVIVSTFILVTLAYFQLLQAVKYSDFVDVGGQKLTSSIVQRSISPFQDGTSVESGQFWNIVPKKEWLALRKFDTEEIGNETALLYIKQVVVSLPTEVEVADQKQGEALVPSFHSKSLLLALSHFQRALERDFAVADIKSYQKLSYDPDLCYRVPKSHDALTYNGPSECFRASILDLWNGDRDSLMNDPDIAQTLASNRAFVQQVLPNPQTAILTFAFEGNHDRASSAWVDTQTHARWSSRLPNTKFTSDAQHYALENHSFNQASDLQYTFVGRGASREKAVAEMRSVRWMAHAIKAFFVRIWGLLRRADSADICIMLTGYILMHGTFVALFLNMRQVGSKFWLGTAVLITSTSAFVLAMYVAYLGGMTVNPILLSEALPFLVITVGFDKPFRLTRAVLTHLSALPSPQMSSDSPPPYAVPVREIVAEAAQSQGPAIVRDYVVEISVLTLGAFSGISGLSEFCQLAALIMACDCLALFTLLVGILTIFLEVRRIKAARTASLPASPTLSSTEGEGRQFQGAQGSTLASNTIPARFVNAIVGEEADEEETSYYNHKPDNPVARLKVLLLIAFLVLHFLNLCTTLTAQTAFDRTSYQPSRRHMAMSNKAIPVDATSETMAPILARIGMNHPLDDQLYVQIDPPVHVDVSLTDKTANAERWKMRSSHTSLVQGESSSLAILEGFMSSWTRFVGDPVLSKWIVIILGVSMFLNGYLLRGIANGNISPLAGEGGRSQNNTGSNEQRQNFNLGNAESLRQQVLNRRHTQKASEESPVSRPSSPPLHRVSSASQIRRSSLALENLDQALIKASASLAEGAAVRDLADEEILSLVKSGKIASYALEKTLKDHERAVSIRRALISQESITKTLEGSELPFEHYDYSKVMGACCENVVGYLPVPVGIAGPLMIDGIKIHIPMATTEGCLVASTSRGCKAINASGGANTVLTQDAMTRGPCVEFPSIARAAKAKIYLDSEEGFAEVKTVFESTSRFARLQTLKSAMAGRLLYIRFATATGDAMGMNMISKGVEKSLTFIRDGQFPDMEIISLSGNYCTDKKPAAINWIEGRGKSVVAEAVLPRLVIENTLKTTVESLVELNTKKNLIGSAMAGSIGGYNAHAANILTAIFIATGQDPAQNVESSQCMTIMESLNGGEELLITCSMPCIEVGTVGGGTILGPQSAMLDLLGVKGPHPVTPGANAQNLARIICAAVMAGELSLLSALSSGDLIKAHMQHNRSALATPLPASAPGHLGGGSPQGASSSSIPRNRSFLMTSINKPTTATTAVPGACLKS